MATTAGCADPGVCALAAVANAVRETAISILYIRLSIAVLNYKAAYQPVRRI